MINASILGKTKDVKELVKRMADVNAADKVRLDYCRRNKSKSRSRSEIRIIGEIRVRVRVSRGAR